MTSCEASTRLPYSRLLSRSVLAYTIFLPILIVYSWDDLLYLIIILMKHLCRFPSNLLSRHEKLFTL
jgi:hypothetical protein